jgi:hypothetical protein
LLGVTVVIPAVREVALAQPSTIISNITSRALELVKSVEGRSYCSENVLRGLASHD